LFNFTDQELSIQPSLNSILLPRGMQTSQATPEGVTPQDSSAGGGASVDLPQDATTAPLQNASGSAVA